MRDDSKSIRLPKARQSALCGLENHHVTEVNERITRGRMSMNTAACSVVTNAHVGTSDPDGLRDDWRLTHKELSRLAHSRAGLDFDEGRWLLAAWRGNVHARLGYGSFREYVERLFGYGSRLVQDKLRVAESLEGLP